MTRVQIPRNLSLDERTWRILHAEAQREAWSVSALIRELAKRLSKEDGKALR